MSRAVWKANWVVLVPFQFGDLDPSSAEFFLQEERLAQMKNEYELQCRVSGALGLGTQHWAGMGYFRVLSVPGTALA